MEEFYCEIHPLNLMIACKYNNCDVLTCQDCIFESEKVIQHYDDHFEFICFSNNMNFNLNLNPSNLLEPQISLVTDINREDVISDFQQDDEIYVKLNSIYNQSLNNLYCYFKENLNKKLINEDYKINYFKTFTDKITNFDFLLNSFVEDINRYYDHIALNKQLNSNSYEINSFSEEFLSKIILQYAKMLNLPFFPSESKNNYDILLLEYHIKKSAISKENKKIKTNRSVTLKTNDRFNYLKHHLTLEKELNFILNYEQLNNHSSCLVKALFIDDKRNNHSYFEISFYPSFYIDNERILDYCWQFGIGVVSFFNEEEERNVSISSIIKNYETQNFYPMNECNYYVQSNGWLSKGNNGKYIKLLNRNLKSDDKIIFYVDSLQNLNVSINSYDIKDMILLGHFKSINILAFLNNPNLLVDLTLKQFSFDMN